MKINIFKNCAVMAALFVGAPALLLSTAPAIQAQTAEQCTGIVVDNEGETLIGATVRVDGTNIATATDIDGNFTLSNVKIGDKITVTYVGYNPVTVTWNGKPLTITMTSDSALLDEVVVLGYGITQSRTNVTNSVAKVQEDVLTIGTNANPAQALVGAVSGVKVYVTSGNPGATPSIEVRGGTNYDGGSNAPLIVVDGQIRDSLSDINPNDIESMNILKDAGATAIYGARAGNGVVIITTKHGKTGQGRVTLNMKVGVNSYADQGYDLASSEDFLYYFRVGMINSGWAWPGTLGAGYSTTGAQIFTGTNGPGYTGGTSYNPTAFYNILQYNDNTKFLSEQHGWKVMEDPATNQMITFKETDILKWNLNSPAVTQDYNVSFSGGNDRGNYYASLGYYDADGAIKSTYYRRYNFSFTGEYRLTNWLTANSVFTYTRSNWLTNFSNGTLGNSDTAYMMNRGRFWNFLNFETIDGEQLYGNANGPINTKLNTDSFDKDNQTDKFQMTQSLTINILPELYIKGSINWLYSEQTFNGFNKAYVTNNTGAMNPTGTSGVNRLYATSNSFYRWFDRTYNVIANYQKTFNEKHYVNVMLGAELYQRKYWGFSASGQGAPGPFQDLALTDPENRSIDSWHFNEALISYFGRAEYNYMERYLLAATFRTDGYSRLINHRWGAFPGVSAGWVFTNEKFWQDDDRLLWLNYGKLRGSFGYNATINSSYLGYYTLWGSYSPYQYDGRIGYRLAGLPNQNLKWERTRTGEVGLTLGFLQNRINFDVTYYNRLTMDKYGAMSLPQTTGFSSYIANVGQFRNQGVEFDVSATPVRTKDFTWTIGANMTWNQNRIVKLAYSGLDNNRQIDTGTEVYNPNWKEGMDPKYKTYFVGGYQEGQNPFQRVGYGKGGVIRSYADLEALGDYIDIAGSYTAMYATEAGRQRLLAMGYSRTSIRPLTPGSYYYEDMNGDNMIDTYDRKVIGHADPTWTGGFNTTLKWKGLQLYARFDMGFGFQVYDSNLSFLLAEGQGAMSFPSQVKDTWKADNPNAKYPRVVWADQYGTDSFIRTSEFWAQNGNYLACRELSLSYEFPTSITSKFKCQGLTVSVTGQNLGYLKSCTIHLPDNTTYWSGNTAGAGGTYNLPKSVIFGLNVSF